MNWAVVAGIMTTFITSAASCVIAWINRGKLAEVHGQGAEQQKAVEEVHGLVNSQRDVMIMRIEQLAKALETAGVKVPLTPPPAVPDGG